MSLFYKNDIFDRFMKLEEAAEFWGVSVPTVKRYCQTGKVDAAKIGQTWLIDKLQPKPIFGRSGIPKLVTIRDYCSRCEQVTEKIIYDMDYPNESRICCTCYRTDGQELLQE